MAAMAEIYSPSREISDGLVELYWRKVNSWGWTIEMFRQACDKLMDVKVIKNFPVPAEIKNALQGDRALQLWNMARSAVIRHGHNMSICFEGNEILHDIIESMGGWERFCHIKLEDLPWRQKDFDRAYENLSDKKDHIEYVAGVLEIQNHSYPPEVRRQSLVRIDVRGDLIHPALEGGKGDNAEKRLEHKAQP
jgi:hypothetical protein